MQKIRKKTYLHDTLRHSQLFSIASSLNIVLSHQTSAMEFAGIVYRLCCSVPQTLILIKGKWVYPFFGSKIKNLEVKTALLASVITEMELG